MRSKIYLVVIRGINNALDLFDLSYKEQTIIILETESWQPLSLGSASMDSTNHNWKNSQIWRASYTTPFYMRPEPPWLWVSTEVLEPNP